MCINDQLCIDQWKFFEVSSSDKFLEQSGVIGFGPVNNTAPQTSFIKALYDAGKIPEMIATFQLEGADTGKTSTLTLGGFPESLIVGDIFTLNAIDHDKLDNQWTVALRSVSIGTYSNPTQDVAIIDTGTSFSILGYSDYIEFINIIANIGGRDANFDCGGRFCFSNTDTCEKFYDDMPTLSLSF